MQSNKEYFNDPYYFFLKDKGDKIVLYYNYSKNLSEARKDDLKIEFSKSNRPNLKKKIDSIIKGKKHKSKKELDSDLKNFKNKVETNEFIDSDGTWASSRIPILDPRVTPKKTTDQYVGMSHITNDPVTRGYRVYYGESRINETDFSDAFGYEETKDMDGKKTFKFLQDKMGLDPDDAAQRTKQFGKDYTGKRTKKAPKKLRKDPNFIDRMTLSEMGRKKMVRMIEEIVKNKNEERKQTNNNEKAISSFLEKNLNSIKKIAEKEGIPLNKLISYLKKGE